MTYSSVTIHLRVEVKVSPLLCTGMSFSAAYDTSSCLPLVVLRMTIPSLWKVVSPNAAPLESLSVLDGTGLTDEGAYFDVLTGIASGRSGGGNDRTFVRANRPRLRQWLMTDVEVKWRKRFKSYREIEDEDGRATVEVTFWDGTTARGDVLVGADGVNSLG